MRTDCGSGRAKKVSIATRPDRGRPGSMKKDELDDLAANPDFISGIYNYCDRWCERCTFTSRCFLYATENADAELDNPEVRDINNVRFWRKMETIFRETRAMIEELAAEAGVDLQAAEADAEREEARREAKEHELSLSSQEYAEMVHCWFKDQFAAEQNVHDDATGKTQNAEDDIDIRDAVDVIRWYQFFIAAKTYRAVMDLEDREEIDQTAEPDPFTEEELDDEDVWLRASIDDSDGSAKIALIAIDRSSNAWRAMLGWMPEKKDSIGPILTRLEQLRRGLEKTFPRARDFIRPGFDEMISDFAS